MGNQKFKLIFSLRLGSGREGLSFQRLLKSKIKINPENALSQVNLLSPVYFSCGVVSQERYLSVHHSKFGIVSKFRFIYLFLLSSKSTELINFIPPEIFRKPMVF